MSDAFRDAITEAVKPQFVMPTNPMKDWITYGTVASKVLAMPEMEAIRKVLSLVGDFGIGVVDADALMAAYYDLPESVIDWVLS